MAERTNVDPKDFSFLAEPSSYKHLRLLVENDEATIELNVSPDGGLFNDTPLKLNSYDLSVDIELNDALMRLRFEHPEVLVVTITSAHPQVFSSGANIYMLKKASHAFKVNFCKYTNETRLHLEEASQLSNKKFLCALNGTAAGGGYELALACDRIVLVNDRSSNVSLPEVPLLGVLPGTGGLTRLSDKRRVRRDIADVFCTLSEGFKAQRAMEHGLVDATYQKSEWEKGISYEKALLKKSLEKKNVKGISLNDFAPKITASGFYYSYVQVSLSDRIATILLSSPSKDEPTNVEAMLEKGSELWLLQLFRELENAVLRLRFFYRDYGVWHFKTEGSRSRILSAERPLYSHNHWFLNELKIYIGQVLRRIETSSRSIVCTIDKHSAYAGVFSELLLLADRSYGLLGKEAEISLSPINKHSLLKWNGFCRLEERYADEQMKEQVFSRCNGESLSLKDALRLGLVTFALDELDFADEIRLFLEERSSLSPDALTAMEANLRTTGKETLATKIFGRLSAWQNWVFIRENATGEHGALVSYGEDIRAIFNWERC